MSRLDAAAAAPPLGGERLARSAERALRLAGDARVAGALLVVAAVINGIAAALPTGPAALAHPAYGVLLGAVLLSGMAATATRLPATWREWRRPGPVVEGRGSFTARLPWPIAPGDAQRACLRGILTRYGYLSREAAAGGRWMVHGTRRGWSRLAGIGTHLALALLVVGAGIGSAFGSETSFSLLPGDQALLDSGGQGSTDAVRLERLDAEFDTDGRPLRLDTEVSFLRDGTVVRREVIAVNDPGDVDGHLVHAQSYGPAAALRIETIGGRTLLAGDVPLDAVRGGRPFAFVELPGVGLTLGVELTDPAVNRLTVTAANAAGLVDAAAIAAGGEARLGGVVVRLEALTAYVTFLARHDPGAPLLMVGALLLIVGLAASLWLPRRRLTLHWAGGTLRVTVRGERFDRPQEELERLRAALEASR